MALDQAQLVLPALNQSQSQFHSQIRFIKAGRAAQNQVPPGHKGGDELPALVGGHIKTAATAGFMHPFCQARPALMW
jgi:hypothetical protein